MDNIFNIPQRLLELDARVMEDCRPYFERTAKIAKHNREKVLKAFMDCRVSAASLSGSTGYGFGDSGRDNLDRLFARIVGSEDALCRAQFLSGTHALTVALFALLRPGDTLMSAVGEPYDTMRTVIGEKGVGSLADFGVKYAECPLKNGGPDLELIERTARGSRVALVQRSRGYSERDALSLEMISEIAAAARRGNPDIIVFVDNCYGEFTCEQEPCAVGADLMAGSLIKNPGGAIAQTGGYVAGRADLVELCGNRLTAPGTGRELGSTPFGLRELYLGIYFAPSVTQQAVDTSIYASRLFELLGKKTNPAYDVPRSDIVTNINLDSSEQLCRFCESIQGHSPVDSFVRPEPWDMPGYDSKVIMAAGAFTEGSSIELSCDAPLREPWRVYLQGGVHLDYSRAALLSAAAAIENV